MKAEKAAQKGGKKTKAAKTKTSLVASRASTADTNAYDEDGFGEYVIPSSPTLFFSFLYSLFFILNNANVQIVMTLCEAGHWKCKHNLLLATPMFHADMADPGRFSTHYKNGLANSLPAPSLLKECSRKESRVPRGPSMYTSPGREQRAIVRGQALGRRYEHRLSASLVKRHEVELRRRRVCL